MKGLDRSRQLFEEQVMPRIREELPDVVPVLAAGLVGEGSECFGYDDEISLDHDAETRICFWLDQENYFKYEGDLRRILEQFYTDDTGRELHLLQGWRSGVFEMGSFYEQLIGLKEAPSSNQQWMKAEETALAAAVNGEVFLDHYGAFSKIRSELSEHYPQDVFLYKLAQEIAIAAQTGQYNYPRAVQRQDFITANMIRAAFIDHIVRAVFLINRRYRPFYKWMYHALPELPVLGKEMYERADALLRTSWDQAVEEIESMSWMLIEELRKQELTENTNDFLLNHVPNLLTKIEDRSLLEKGISLVI